MTSIVLDADSTTLVLNGRAIVHFLAGDTLTLTPGADHSSHVNGSNGGVTINKRTDADVMELMMRIQRFSVDDVFLNNALNGGGLPIIFNGSVKEDFQRDGKNFKESWVLENGSLTKQPTVVKNDSEGNALMEYTIKFRHAHRSV